MPATVITEEKLEKSATKAAIKRAIDLRIAAGAIKSWVEDGGTHWLLKTEWNVFGQNVPDPMDALDDR